MGPACPDETRADLLVVLLSNEDNEVSAYLPEALAVAALPELPVVERPVDEEQQPFAIERLKFFDTESLHVSESIEFTGNRELAGAGFLISLEAGHADWRVIDPDENTFAQGSVRAGESVEE